MKPMRKLTFITLAALLVSAGAFAQSSNRVPGPTDYSAFSQFITDRNIFDPNRQPHYTSSRTRTYSRPATHSSSAPAFSLVGTMAYEKGMFAFFNVNNEDLKKALYVSGHIAGYTGTKINYGSVTLETTNQADKIELKLGDVMREENGAWQLTGPGEVASSSSAGSDSGSNRYSRYGGDRYSSDVTAEKTDARTSAPPSAAESNDILKRLMEKREQENK
jgi:hypothetical protein